EEFLQALLEAEELVAVVRVVVEQGEALAEMGERVERVRHVGTAVLADVLEHLDPGGKLPFQHKVDGGQVEITDLRHLAAVEHFEGQQVPPLPTAVTDDVHPEGGIDKTEAAKTRLVLSHGGLESLEEREGGGRYFQNS